MESDKYEKKYKKSKKKNQKLKKKNQKLEKFMQKNNLWDDWLEETESDDDDEEIQETEDVKNCRNFFYDVSISYNSEKIVNYILNDIINLIEEKVNLIKCLNETYSAYRKHGARSNKKTNILHKGLIKILKKCFPKNYIFYDEIKIKCYNASGTKKCDIVAYNKDNKLTHIFPVKFPLGNYKQNKNNYLENMIGEIILLEMCNEGVEIIPINIFPYKVPYKKQDKTIQKMEIITDKDVAPYNDKNLFDKSIVIRVDIDYERHIVKDISYHKKGLKDIIFS